MQMHGVVAAAMRLSQHSEMRNRVVKKKRKHRHHKRILREIHLIVTAVWASVALPADQVFDVQQRKSDGSWATVRDGTTTLSGEIDTGTVAGKTAAFRARVRRGNDPSAASDWSPVATIVTR